LKWKKNWLRVLYIFAHVLRILAVAATTLGVVLLVRLWKRRPRVEVLGDAVGIRAPLLPDLAVAVLLLAFVPTLTVAFP
jgi:hypothetical protein